MFLSEMSGPSPLSVDISFDMGVAEYLETSQFMYYGHTPDTCYYMNMKYCLHIEDIIYFVEMGNGNSLLS